MQHSEETIDAVVAALQAEKPVISDAVKTLISLVVASHATAADRAAAPKGAGDLAMVTSCGRALLKAINSHVLPPPPQWALEHPQAEQETALERIETMTTYRACHALAARCAKAGAKPTRMLGRGFLRGTRCLETVSDSCRAQLLEQRFPPPLVDTFLDRFGRSLDAVCRPSRRPLRLGHISAAPRRTLPAGQRGGGGAGVGGGPAARHR